MDSKWLAYYHFRNLINLFQLQMQSNLNNNKNQIQLKIQNMELFKLALAVHKIHNRRASKI